MKIDKTKIQVRFADCDMMGHVNNAMYLNYFETTRLHYFNALLGNDWNWSKDGFIVVKNVVEYKLPVFLNDEVEIELKTKHIGSKSFTVAYTLYANGVIKTIGESVLVSFDYTLKDSVAIPIKLVDALKKIK